MQVVLVVSEDPTFGDAVKGHWPDGPVLVVRADGAGEMQAMLQAATFRLVAVDLATVSAAAVAALPERLASPTLLVPSGADLAWLLAAAAGADEVPVPEVAAARPDLLTVGPLVIDREAWEVRLDGQVVEVSSREFRLLEVLIAHHGRPLTRERLIEQAFARDFVGSERLVDVAISRLRRNLLDLPACPVTITAVFRCGYRLAFKEEPVLA